METTDGRVSSSRSFESRQAFTGAPCKEDYGVLPNSILDKRSYCIEAYLQALDEMRGPIGVETELPFSKEEIGEAILAELSEYPEFDLRRRLEIAYVLLGCFIPLEEYRVIEDFKDASFCAQRIAGSGDPVSIVRSANMMKNAKGDRAVRLQEKIHENIRKREIEIFNLRQAN